MSKDFKEIKDMIDKERELGAFIFLPSPILSMKDSFFMPLAETVMLREDEIYKAKENQFRIHYNGLLRLAGAACIKWGVENTRRTDNRNDKLYCSFMAVGGVLRADGSIQWHKAEKDIDLEVIRDELLELYDSTWEKAIKKNSKTAWKIKGYSDKKLYMDGMIRRDMIKHRKNKLTNAESGAKARVIRSVLGLQGTYSKREQLIGMPFIMIHFVQNMNHPELKKHLLNALGTTQDTIYGNRAGQRQVEYYDQDIKSNDDVIDIELSSSLDSDESERKHNKQVYDKHNKKDDLDGYTGKSFKSQKLSLKEGPSKPAEKKEEYTLEVFQSSDVGSQVKILEELCKDVEGESVANYDQSDVKNQIWRDGFFEHLIKEKGEKS